MITRRNIACSSCEYFTVSNTQTPHSRYDASTSQLFKLQWSSIDEVINGETTTMVYEPITGLAPIYLCKYLLKFHLEIFS